MKDYFCLEKAFFVLGYNFVFTKVGTTFNSF